VIPSLSRLALVLQGDRLIVASLHRGRLETFVVEAEQPSAALRAELDARGIGTRNVAVGLPRAATTVKPIELPDVGNVDEMVRFELERHLPFPAEDAPFAFIPLAIDPSMPANGGRRVLVAAADRRIVDSAIRIAQDAGLRPTSVTIAPHDLLALVNAPRDRRIVWVHRVGDDAEVLFALGSTLALSRRVPDAGNGAIVVEIRRSLSVVRWRAIDEAWISGDGASLDTLAELACPITEPPYTARARTWLGEMSGDARGSRELALAVAAGWRIRPLDLIPAALRPSRLTRSELITIGSAAAAIVLVIAALLMPGYRDRARLASLNTEIARLTPDVRAVEAIQKELERKRALLATIETAQANAIKPLPVLRELTELLPNDAWLTLVSLDNKGIELTGQAAAASALIPLLENSPRFERVEFASPVTRGRDREQFRIIARWEGGSPSAAPATASVTPATPPTVTPQSPRPTQPALVPSAPAAPPPSAPPPPGIAERRPLPPAGQLDPEEQGYAARRAPTQPGNIRR
jgi:Tfp pilus assembly protein PilN